MRGAIGVRCIAPNVVTEYDRAVASSNLKLWSSYRAKTTYSHYRA